MPDLTFNLVDFVSRADFFFRIRAGSAQEPDVQAGCEWANALPAKAAEWEQQQDGARHAAAVTAAAAAPTVIIHRIDSRALTRARHLWMERLVCITAAIVGSENKRPRREPVLERVERSHILLIPAERLELSLTDDRKNRAGRRKKLRWMASLSGFVW